MNAQDIIKEAEEYASEWTEMSNNPAAVVAGVLANKIIQMQEYIEFLEKMAGYESTRH